MHDLVIRGGTLVDGTGAPRVTADVGIDGGRITAVGRVETRGRREIAADGLVVAPGWVDIHTHYDGQATWDPDLTPSSWHGVTTAVMGNCGVGFAPARPDQRAWMIELMEGVEDIPGVVLEEGIRWSWESFPQYLDALDRMPRAIDVGAQLAHGPLRVYTMGERGARREPATADDLATMARLAEEAVRAGALGFSTSRTIVHQTRRGDAVPSLGVASAELQAIARGLRAADAGVVQLISDFEDVEAEFQLVRDVARAGGRPLSFTLLQTDFFPEKWRDVLGRVERARADGLDIKVQVACRAIGMLLGFDCSMHPFINRPSYRAIAELPHAARVTRLRDPAVRRAILGETPESLTRRLDHITQSFYKLFPFGDPPDYEPAPEQSIAASAARAGRPAQDVAYDLLLEDGGTRMLYFPMYNYTSGDFSALHTMMTHPAAIPGLGDAGAHCSYICDASYPTYLVAHWARDRTRGPKLSLEALVRAQARDAALAAGLRDRGVLAPGMKADLNVFDFARLGIAKPRIVRDLPAGGRRLVQDATGYVATVVAGAVIRQDGEATGAMPGRLVRGGQAAP